MKKTINHLIDALRLADGGELAANLENTQSTIGIGNAVAAILDAYKRGTLPGQKDTVYDSMLDDAEFHHVAQTAVVQHAGLIVDAMHHDTISDVYRVIAGIIKDDLDEHKAEFEGRE